MRYMLSNFISKRICFLFQRYQCAGMSLLFVVKRDKKTKEYPNRRSLKGSPVWVFFGLGFKVSWYTFFRTPFLSTIYLAKPRRTAILE